MVMIAPWFAPPQAASASSSSIGRKAYSPRRPWTQRSIDRGRPIAGANGNLNLDATLARCDVGLRNQRIGGDSLGRGLLLWLIGIPIPIILLIWIFGGLH